MFYDPDSFLWVARRKGCLSGPGTCNAKFLKQNIPFIPNSNRPNTATNRSPKIKKNKGGKKLVVAVGYKIRQ